MITTGLLVTVLSNLVDLTVKIAEIIRANRDLDPADKELFKAKIKEMQDKVTAWD